MARYGDIILVTSRKLIVHIPVIRYIASPIFGNQKFIFSKHVNVI